MESGKTPKTQTLSIQTKPNSSALSSYLTQGPEEFKESDLEVIHENNPMDLSRNKDLKEASKGDDDSRKSYNSPTFRPLSLLYAPRRDSRNSGRSLSEKPSPLKTNNQAKQIDLPPTFDNLNNDFGTSSDSHLANNSSQASRPLSTSKPKSVG